MWLTVLTGDRLPDLDLGGIDLGDLDLLDLAELLDPAELLDLLLDLVRLRDLVELSLLGGGSTSFNVSLRLGSEKTHKMYESLIVSCLNAVQFKGKFFSKGAGEMSKLQTNKPKIYMKLVFPVNSTNRILGSF